MSESKLEGRGLASGKVVLFGEHAVVHGTPAIAAGLSQGANARVSKSVSDSITLNGMILSANHELFYALAALRKQLNTGPVNLALDLQLPPGAGLGASAAMGLATARALVSLSSQLEEGTASARTASSDDSLFQAAQAWEDVFHGNSSGVDIAAAQESCAIRFTRGKPPEPLKLGRSLHLAIAQAGPPASTKEMVANVEKFKSRNLVQFNRTLSAIRALVDNSVHLLAAGDLSAVGKLMDMNQMLLASWMISTEEIERACHLARQAGALGAKLTGAGGGGSVIALADPSAEHADEPSSLQAPSPPPALERIVDTWRKAGISCFSAEISGSDS